MGEPYHDAERLRELYHGDGLTLSEIGERLDTTAATISRWMDKHGIEKRSQGPSVADERVKDAEWMERQYSVRQKSVGELSDETGCSNKTILKWLDKHGIHTRPQKRLASDPRVYDCEYLREQYVSENRHAGEIADKLDCGKTTVLRQMEECGIERRSKADASSMASERVERARFYTDIDGYEREVVATTKGAMNIGVHQLLTISEGADPSKVFSNGEYHVHHKNGIPWDNRPENIELLTNSEHNKRHANE